MPIMFDPTPFPLLPNDCDGPDAFSDTSAVTEANFAKVNGWLTSSTPPRVQSWGNTQLQQVTVTGDKLTFTGFSPTQWPALDFTLPNPCVALLVIVNVVVMCTITADLWVGFKGQGAGIVTTNADAMGMVAARLCQFQGGRSYLFRGAELAPGQAVKLQPGVIHRNANPASCWAEQGSLQAIAFSGQP